MTRLILFALLLFAPGLRAGADLKILLVIGAAGTETYAVEFAETAALWIDAARRGGAEIEVHGLEPRKEGDPPDAERVRDRIAAVTAPELWLVLVGHGTFDQREVKFNLQGADVTDGEMAQWLEAYSGRLCVINTASASGSFVKAMSQPGRIVITSTKNEGEQSYSRFGRFFAEAVGGRPEADLDNDEQVSLLEAFLAAAHRVAEFYKSEGRIATEHALLDDNGDSLGSRSEWFEGTRPKQAPAEGAEPDGDLAAQRVLVRNEFERRLTAGQRETRDDLERRVTELRRKKGELEEAAYYEKLEALLLELARLYQSVTAGGS